MGCAATPDGSILYVLDNGGSVYMKSRLRKFVLATREVTTVAGAGTWGDGKDGSGTDAQFDNPRNMVLNGDASIAYIAEYDGQTIRQVDLASGNVTTLAGKQGENGYADGVGTDAEFYRPWGIAFHASPAAPAGLLYVTDSQNKRIRQLDVATRQVRLRVMQCEGG